MHPPSPISDRTLKFFMWGPVLLEDEGEGATHIKNLGPHWGRPHSLCGYFFMCFFRLLHRHRVTTAETLGKSRGPPQSLAETPQNPRRHPAEPSERPPQSPLRGKFPRRASRRVVPLRMVTLRNFRILSLYHPKFRKSTRHHARRKSVSQVLLRRGMI